MNRSLWAVAVLAALSFAVFLLPACAESEQAKSIPVVSTGSSAEGLSKATFAGGCFWCMEPPFDKLDGVVSTTSGYAGGAEPNPTYESVSAGRTSHAEVVQIVFDSEKVSYEELLHVFWRNVDPLTPDRQFCDGGRQYRTAIFAHDAEQLAAAIASRGALISEGRFDQPIVTEVAEVGTFTAAESYHQDYYQRNPIRYKYYRGGCGRDKRLEALWGSEAGGGMAAPQF